MFAHFVCSFAAVWLAALTGLDDSVTMSLSLRSSSRPRLSSVSGERIKRMWTFHVELVSFTHSLLQQQQQQLTVPSAVQ